jgi:hypothetical protein
VSTRLDPLPAGVLVPVSCYFWGGINNGDRPRHWHSKGATSTYKPAYYNTRAQPAFTLSIPCLGCPVTNTVTLQGIRIPHRTVHEAIIEDIIINDTNCLGPRLLLVRACMCMHAHVVSSHYRWTTRNTQTCKKPCTSQSGGLMLSTVAVGFNHCAWCLVLWNYTYKFLPYPES